MSKECPRRLAIVDDDPAFTHLIEQTFRREGDFEVYSINAPIAALKELHQYQPDIILLDVMMPGLDGARLHYLIKQDPQLKNVPVIILSGLVGSHTHHYPKPTRQNSQHRTLRLGKPIHPVSLKHTVELELNRHREEQEASKKFSYPITGSLSR